MKKIRLIGELDMDLKLLGIKINDTVNVEEFNRTTGAAYFKKQIGGLTINCVVWPANYEILEDEKLEVQKALERVVKTAIDKIEKIEEDVKKKTNEL